jgi:hypothetical protein
MSRRLKMLLLVLGVFSAFGAVLFWPTPRRQAIARVEQLGGTYSQDRSGGGTVSIVGFIGQPVTDDDLTTLRNIRPLHRVLLDGTKVTDAGLAHLEGIEGLEWVSVCKTAVTDAGLVHLSKIPSLRQIHIRNTRVTDAGVVYLHGMPNLEFINLAQTRVTPAGVKALRRATPRLTDVYHVIPED